MQAIKSRSLGATNLGIILMVAGVFLYSLNDAIAKWLLMTYSVGTVLLIRATVSLLLLSPFIFRAGPAPFRRARRPLLQLFRVALASAEGVLFFWAVTHLPLAVAVTFYLAGPIYVAALSSPILREVVGWRRWIAVVVGFVGVVIALDPVSTTFVWPMLIPLAGGFCYAMVMLLTRMLRETPDIVLATGQTLTSLAIGVVLSIFSFQMPSFTDFVFIGGLAVVATLALVSVNRSLMIAPASAVVPYQYMFILWAAIFGYYIFDEFPTNNIVVGSCVIVSAGLYIFYREQKAR